MMLFFTAAEVINKLLGILILAMLSRILGVENFIQYSAVLIVFGYFLELSFFSYQSRNLVDSNGDANFIYTPEYLVRTKVLTVLSVMSFVLFLALSPAEWALEIWPLAIILLLPVCTLDFCLFAKNLSQYVIISRFIAQITVCVFLIFFYFFSIDLAYIFVVNLLNSLLLTFFVIFFAIKLGGLSLKRLSISLIDSPTSIRPLWLEFNVQKTVFASRIMVLLIVSYEIALLTMMGVGQYDDMVLGSRLAIIVLPFLHFYLNSNMTLVNENNYLKYIISNAIGVIALILISPLLIYILFGESYLSEGFLMNSYMSIIIFQAFINYVFLIALKAERIAALAKRLFFVALFSVILLLLSFNFVVLTPEVLLILVVAKVLLVVMICPGVPLRYRAFTCLLFLIPLTMNFALIELGYFEMVTSQVLSIRNQLFGAFQ